MYENNIYSNYDSGRSGDGNANPATGNFSGAQDVQVQPETRQSTEQQAIWQSGNPQPTGQQIYRTYEPYQTYQPVSQPEQKGKIVEGKKPGTFSKLLLSVSLGLLFGIFAGIGFFAVQQGMRTMQDKELQKGIEQMIGNEPGVGDIAGEGTEQEAQPANSPVIYTSVESDVSDIVETVMPAMVSIINNYTQVTSFWGRTYEEEISSSGSGIIVGQTDEELLIVSNNHVVADADELLVTLIDGTEVEAHIKGLDSEMDLAVIAVDLDELSEETKNSIVVATLGDSDMLRMGQRVIAIGNALGYGQSTTVGYISALNREIELDDGSMRTFIQTDAAINPGNSGGALLNMAGEVIGINSNKIGGDAIEGMGYAIPMTTASPIIADLMERQTRNKVSSSKMGYMGITIEDVTDQIAQMFGMPKGVYVKTVTEGSGAEAAGMLQGDVIVKFDGERVSSRAELQNMMQYFAVGDTAEVIVMRPENGEYVEYQLTVTLGKRPPENK